MTEVIKQLYQMEYVKGIIILRHGTIISESYQVPCSVYCSACRRLSEAQYKSYTILTHGGRKLHPASFYYAVTSGRRKPTSSQVKWSVSGMKRHHK